MSNLFCGNMIESEGYDISKTEARIKIAKRKISGWEMQNNLSLLFFFIFFRKTFFISNEISISIQISYNHKSLRKKKKKWKILFLWNEILWITTWSNFLLTKYYFEDLNKSFKFSKCPDFFKTDFYNSTT